MKQFLTYAATVMLILAVHGQVDAQRDPAYSDYQPTGVKSEVQQVKRVGHVAGVPNQEPWRTVMQKVAIYHQSADSIDALKQDRLHDKDATAVPAPISGSRAVTPQLGTGIAGTTMNYYTPPDNTMAISNNGRIVAVDNEDISYFNETGTQTGTATHTSFFSGMTSSSYLFDPKVLYDSGSDRFIYVLLHGTSSSTSKIFVCFSKSNDPENDGWEIYSFPGNPLSDGSWTDYPNIGVSEDELFITTNLFYDNSAGFNQSVVYQIDKSAGYSGASSIDYVVWDDIFDANGAKAFTIVPASHGQQGNYGPQMYFASSRPGGSTRIYLYEISDNMDGNASLYVDDIIANYAVAADGYQSGSSSLVDVGDCRMQNAFYLNGTVHAVHAGEYFSTGYSGVHYYRIPVDATNLTENAVFGQSGFDYAYPSLASFGLTECDQGVMIGALKTGSSIYPQMAVVNCDESMNFSSPVTVVTGASPISFIGSPERWGDYSAMQRKHNASSPEVWMAGCHTNSGNRYRTRIAEIKGDYTAPEGPEVSFYSSDSLGEPIYFVNFYDNSTGGAVAWEWTFEGGIPFTSTQQNPLVSYSDTGVFDVKLIAWNDECFDSLVVEDMIEVVDKIPSDTDTLVIGETTAYVIDGDTFELFNGEFVPLSVEDWMADEFRIYPNPSNGVEMVMVELDMPVAGNVEAVVYDMRGAEVKTLFADYVKAGKHRFGFNKLALNNGQYILKLSSGQQIIAHETIIVQR